MANDTVTKIYELRVSGYDDVFSKIGSLTKQWEAAKKAKQAYDSSQSSRDNSRRYDEESQKVKALEKQINELVNSVNRLKAANEAANASRGTGNQVSEYAKLLATYKQAEAAARNMAAAYGVESTQAKEAAASAKVYKDQLVQINTLVKGSGTKQLTDEQLRNAEAMKKQAGEARQLAKEFIANANSIEKLRAQLAIATAKRNKLEIDSTEFKEAEAEVLRLNTQLKDLESRGGDFRRNVGNYASGFDGIRNSVNQLTREVPAFTNSIQTGFLALSNNLPIFFDEITRTRTEVQRLRAEGQQVPGVFQRIATSLFSWGTALSIGITLLITYGKEIGNFVSALFKGRQALDQFAERQKLVSESLKDSSLLNSITEFKQLTINIDLAKKGILDKDEVLNQYNTTLGNVTGELKNLDEAEQNLVKNGDKYIQYLIKRVVAQKAAEKSAQALLEAEEIKRRNPNEFLTFSDRAATTPIPVPGQRTPDQSEFQKRLEEERAKRNQQAQVDAKKVVESLYFGIAQQVNAEADADLASIIGDRGKTKTGSGSNLDGFTKDALKTIDAQIKTRLALEKTGFNEILKVRAATFDEEVTYLRRLEAIEEDGLLKKIQYLSRKKKLNAEEQQTVAELKEQLSSLYLETNTKVNDIEQRRVDFQEKLINQELENLKQAAADRRDLVLNDPSSTNAQRASAVITFDQDVLNAQLEAQKKLEALGLQFTIQARERARQAIEESRKILAADQKKAQLADLKDIEANGRVKITQIEGEFAVIRKTILDNDKLTDAQRKKQLAELEKAENRTILSAQVETMTAQVAVLKSLLDQNIIDNETYQNALAALRKKGADLSGISGDPKKDDSNLAPRNLRDLVIGGRTGRGGLRGLIGVDPTNPDDQEEDKLLGQVIATSFDVAKEAMEGYFAAEEQNIRNSLKIQLERLRIEEEQALNRAQSAQEEEALRRQFDEKKRAEEKKAGEELKKVKIAEARIALATELANIAAAAAANPANGPTLGAAGIAMYAVLAGLAVARYAVNVGNINRTQFFEQGGQVPTKGGKFGGKPHSEGGTPFEFKGQSFEAEVDELAVIRTKNAPKNRVYSVTGNQSQIASMLNQIGGGVAFAPGAKLQKFELGGQIGEVLQPPQFTTSNTVLMNASQYGSEQLQALKDLLVKFDNVAAEQSARIDRLEVVQVTGTVTAAQKKQVLQANIASL